MYCICGALAKEAAEAAEGEPALELVTAPAAAIADLLHEETGTWVAYHGGWVYYFLDSFCSIISKYIIGHINVGICFDI